MKWQIYSNDKLQNLVLPASKQTRIPKCLVGNRNVVITSKTCYRTATERRQPPVPFQSTMRCASVATLSRITRPLSVNNTKT